MKAERTFAPPVLVLVTMVRRTFVLLILLLISAISLADGKFFSPEVGVEPGIRYQKALVVFDGKSETMVIESAPNQARDGLAWLVPIPARPSEVKLGKLGVLSYLEPQLQPKVGDGASMILALALWLLLWSAIAMAHLFSHNGRHADPAKAFRGAVAFGLLGFLCSAIFMAFVSPVFASSKFASVRSGASLAQMGAEWSQFGPYEARWVEGRAGLDWLERNGVNTTHDEKRVLRDYADRGWAFFAARLAKGRAAEAPQPISLSFPASRAVYPMRLTGLSGMPLTLDLYVAAHGSANANGMAALRSAHLSSLTAKVHPFFQDFETQKWLVTRLRATLSPRQMSNDLDIRVGSAEESTQTIWKQADAAMLALSAFVVMLTLLGFVAGRRICLGGATSNRRDWIAFGVIAVVSLSLYASLPKMTVRVASKWNAARMGKLAFSEAWSVLYYRYFPSLDSIRQELKVKLVEGDAIGQFELLKDEEGTRVIVHSGSGPQRFALLHGRKGWHFHGKVQGPEDSDR